MRILIIRHSDPDYSNDTITEKGQREAEMTALRLAKYNIKSCCVSPLGRARDTAFYTLKKLGLDPESPDWMCRYQVLVTDKKTGEKHSPWDMLPEYWTAVPEYYSKDKWCSVPPFSESGMKDVYDSVCSGLDEVLERHGYKREENFYRVTAPNEDTIAFFCHFGVETLMLSHLLNISPVLMWHGFIAAPSSVTILTTEERREGTAYFRMSEFGGTEHLYLYGETPSKAGSFSETFR